jgi:hypothetical protein
VKKIERGKREEGRGKREEGRGKREEGRGKREEGRGKRKKKRKKEKAEQQTKMVSVSPVGERRRALSEEIRRGELTGVVQLLVGGLVAGEILGEGTEIEVTFVRKEFAPRGKALLVVREGRRAIEELFFTEEEEKE